MNDSAGLSPLDRELGELRARAYGPHPDIQDDPEALARLAELESAHLDAYASAVLGDRGSAMLGSQPSQESVAIAPEATVEAEARPPGAVVEGGEAAQPGSLWQKAITTRTGRAWLVVGAALVVLGASYAVSFLAAPNLAATLQPTGVEADVGIRTAVGYAPLAELDKSTLRGFEPYQGLAPWVADGAQGSRCLMLIEGSNLWGIRCAPPEAALMIDIGDFPPSWTSTYSEGLADGTVIRFQLRGDAVDAYLYPPPSAD